MHVEALGTAQDGGVPHLGCDCERCARARSDPAAVRYAASLLVRSDAGGDPTTYLVDAPPDLRYTLAAVPDGVVLTHAHLGHLPGLLSLGPEAGDATDCPVYCTPSLAALVRENDPFRVLVDEGNVALRPLEPATDAAGDGASDAAGTAAAADARERVALGDGTLSLHRVPHRAETGTDTVAVEIAGPERMCCYLPDVDGWTDAVVALVDRADVALVDGTFFDADEVGGIAEFPHPTITGSMDVLADCSADVRFVHLNHTNPALAPDSPERRAVEDRGFGVVERGDTVDL